MVLAVADEGGGVWGGRVEASGAEASCSWQLPLPMRGVGGVGIGQTHRRPWNSSILFMVLAVAEEWDWRSWRGEDASKPQRLKHHAHSACRRR